MNTTLTKSKSIVDLLVSLNLFDQSFWEKNSNNVHKDNIVSIVKILKNDITRKEISTKNIKVFQKFVKNLHKTFPDYQKELERTRKKHEQVPEDFMSDEEIKEAQEKFAEFKPPKPLKPGKKPHHHRTSSNASQGSQGMMILGPFITRSYLKVP